MAKSWSLAEVRELFLQWWPVGTLYDWFTSTSEISGLVDAAVHVLKAYGFDLVERFRDEVIPISIDEKIQAWEGVLGLATSVVATSGTTIQRRNAVLSKLREYGSDTPAFIRQVIEPLLGYSAADSGTAVVLETPRYALRVAHTYRNTDGMTVAPSGLGTQTVAVADDAHMPAAGFVLTVWLTCANAGVLYGDIGNGTCSATITAGGFGTGPLVNQPVQIVNRSNTGLGITGTWTLNIHGGVSGCTVHLWQLFVEGIGRDSTGREGLGSSIFEYGVYSDPTKENGANYSGARAALARISHAHKLGRLLLTINAIPDDSRTLPDACIPAGLLESPPASAEMPPAFSVDRALPRADIPSVFTVPLTVIEIVPTVDMPPVYQQRRRGLHPAQMQSVFRRSA